MNKRNKVLGFTALMLLCSLFVGNIASAAGYQSFKYVFNYAPNIPSDAIHLEQTVEVPGNANANAYAKCTAYSYTGNRPVLTVDSASPEYPTPSTSFTGTTSTGQKMRYTSAIPPTNMKVKFKGKVTNYTTFTISAQVKG